MPVDDTPRPSDRQTAPQRSSATPQRHDRLAVRENRLWIPVLIVLMALATGFAVIAYWQGGEPAHELRILPGSLLLLVLLFGIYVWSKSSEMAELRGLVRGLEHRDDGLPDLNQLEKLFGMVQRSQQGYRDLIDTFEDLLFSISLDGHLIAANRSCADLLGHPFSALVGRPLEEFIEPVDVSGRASAEAAMPRLLERRGWSGVLRIRLKRPGAVRYFQCSVHVLSRNGKDYGLGVLAHDITQQKEDEARFTELFETLQEGVYVATHDGRLSEINPAMALMLGYQSRQELFGRPLSEFFQQPEEWEAQQQQMAYSGVLHGREVVLRRRDGSTVTCLQNSALIRDTGGRASRQQGTFVDITERRSIEQRLHREQEFARRLIDCFPDLVVALDRDGRCTFVSPRSEETLGYAPGELVGHLLAEHVDARDRAELMARLEGICAAEGESGIDVLVERRNGDMRLFRTTASPLSSEAGEYEGMIVSMRDITESKRIEQQLIQSERLAAMGQMIAGVAHELNNPLTAVLGVTEMLRDSGKEESERRQLELAHGQARRAAQIVQSLLSFARPPHPRKTRLHLSDIIERCLQFHERSLRANHITVDFTPKPDLPAVLGDPSQLTQVFLNLIVNAEQAIREVRDHGALRIRLAALGDRVVVTLQDDGVGIRRDILPRIFDPFFTTKRPGRGTGLGLSICLAILREHNGQIEAQPLVDGGAVFTISLPVAKGTDLVIADPEVHRKDAEPSGSLAGSSLLVVDDEEGIREMVRDGLSARGVRVEVASSGEEALCLMESRSYDVVLCDLNLKSAIPSAISGQELYARVAGLAAGITPGRATRLAAGAPEEHKPLFIFMTGDLVEETTIVQSTGAQVRTLQKPFRISQVAALISQALNQDPSRDPQTTRTS